ncbi:hypothetical protein EXIGLDRAFT_746642 [Exidia glandulosa HHB12029]|uniref:F-box domain-containing protein n=1 Tax=Exidia glandulosa HHB12029 TaxID=1314781 RepID=A0A165LSW7_EXIGL|nr:hypothetical protein EXIGLDRAFT_746642 [Exidia glandulosa HHB12029]
MTDGDGDLESDTASFQELAYRLAVRAFDASDVPSDVVHTLHAVAQRGFAKAGQSHNSRQVVAQLPAELLGIVFSRLSLHDRLRVLSVCHRWRTIGLANCLLWNYLHTSMHPDLVNWQLQHSGSAPLHVDAYLLSSEGTAYANLIAAAMGRVKILDISATAEQLSCVLSTRAPCLQELHVQARGDDSDHHTLDLGPAGGVRWPVLRKLDLQFGLSTDVDLTHFLAMCPRLELLRCGFSEDSNGSGLSAPILSYLPHLRDLELIGHTRQLLVVLPALHAVHEVRIYVVDADDDNVPLLLPSLLTRHATNLPVKAFIADDEIRLQLERGKRTLVHHSLDDESWLFHQSTVFRSLTSLVLASEGLRNRQFPAAPALRTLFISNYTLSQWRDYGFTWTTPELRTICIGCDFHGLRDDFDVAPIDRAQLAIVLQDVFAFSTDRRLPILSLRNVLLSDDTDVEGQLLVEDLVEAVDVVRDLDWHPWAESISEQI